MNKRIESGITLIALVVTIVVLLILAGASIAMLIGENGLINKAQESNKQTDIANIKEEIQTDISGKQSENEGNITEDELKKILEKYGELSNEVKLIDKTLTTTDGKHKIKVSDIWNGKTSNVVTLAKETLTIDPTSTDTSNRTPHVRYNGFDCRVLYNDDNHGIQIVTDRGAKTVYLGYGDQTSQELVFNYDGKLTLNNEFKKAAASYNNAINNLNNEAKTCMDSDGIAMDARCIGSIATLNNESKFQEDDTTEMWSGTYSYLTDFSLNNRFVNSNTNYVEDLEQMRILQIKSSRSTVWVASRHIIPKSEYTTFGIGYLQENGVNVVTEICKVKSTGSAVGNSQYFGIRAVFLISPDSRITGGDGSSSNPYILEK